MTKLIKTTVIIMQKATRIWRMMIKMLIMMSDDNDNEDDNDYDEEE